MTRYKLGIHKFLKHRTASSKFQVSEGRHEASSTLKIHIHYEPSYRI